MCNVYFSLAFKFEFKRYRSNFFPGEDIPGLTLFMHFVGGELGGHDLLYNP